jgi:hypothetical protein
MHDERSVTEPSQHSCFLNCYALHPARHCLGTPLNVEARDPVPKSPTTKTRGLNKKGEDLCQYPVQNRSAKDMNRYAMSLTEVLRLLLNR